MRITTCLIVLFCLTCFAIDLEEQEIEVLLRRAKKEAECPHVPGESFMACPYYEKRLIDQGFCISKTESNMKGSKYYYRLPEGWSMKIIPSFKTKEWILFNPLGIPVMKTFASDCVDELCFSEYIKSDIQWKGIFDEIYPD